MAKNKVNTIVYPVGTQLTLAFPGFSSETNAKNDVPNGEGHIFLADDILHDTRYSLCGKSRDEIGDKVVERTTRLLNLPMCKDCIDRWKDHPLSGFKRLA